METIEEKSDKSRPSSNRRGPHGQPDCILAIGSQFLAAVFAEETESSVHVLIQGNPLFWVEEAGVLQMSDMEVPVRVSNIVRVEMESDEDEFAPSTPMFRVGLARLGRSEGPLRPEPSPVPAKDARSKLLSLSTLAKIRPSWAGLIALAMIVTPLLLMAAAWIYVRPASPAASLEKVTDGAKVELPSSPMGGNSSAPSEPDAAILRLPGVEPFLNEAVARKLELTPSQEGACQRLNDTTQAALVDLEKYWETTGRLEIARRRNVLLEAARREALQLLTDQQRQQWDALTP